MANTINKVSNETREKIRKKSVLNLPNKIIGNPELVKQAFTGLVIDSNNSALGEIDRVVEEVNALFDYYDLPEINNRVVALETGKVDKVVGKDLVDNEDIAQITTNKNNITNLQNNKIDKSEKGVANGVATLDTSGKVPASQLPSFVDDVLEYNTLAQFPTTGETGKIYLDKQHNKTYRWSGTSYVVIGSDLALGETSSTAYSGDKGKANRDDINAILDGTKQVGDAIKALRDSEGNIIKDTYLKKGTSVLNIVDVKTHTLDSNPIGETVKVVSVNGETRIIDNVIKNANPKQIISKSPNLFNLTEGSFSGENYIITETGFIRKAGVSTEINYEIDTITNQEYTLSMLKDIGNRVYIIDVATSTTIFASDFTSTTALITFTALGNKTLLRFNTQSAYRGTTTEWSNIMLNEGTEALPYQPYARHEIALPDLSVHFPNGLGRLPNGVYDEVGVKRLGMRAYQIGDELDSNIITDMTNTLYQLETPIPTSITLPDVPTYNRGYIEIDEGRMSLEIPVLYAHNIRFNGSDTNYLTDETEVDGALKELDTRVKVNDVVYSKDIFYRDNRPIIFEKTITFPSPLRLYAYSVNLGNYKHSLILNEPIVLTWKHNSNIVWDTKNNTIKHVEYPDEISEGDILLFKNIDGKMVSGALMPQYLTEQLQVHQSNKKYKSVPTPITKTNIKRSGAPNGTVVVGDEYWAFSASNDEHTNYANCYRWKIEEDYTLTYIGHFSHNWGHCNSVDYREEIDTLILGNGSGDYNLSGKIFIIPNASQLKTMEQAPLEEVAIIIDVGMTFGSKVNVVWGNDNDGQFDIAHVITNDNKNIRRIQLGKTDGQFDGTYRVIQEFMQEDGGDVVQGAVFGRDGYLYVGLGHLGAWYVKQWLNENGTIEGEVHKSLFYNPDGTINGGFTEAISEYKDKLILRIVKDGQQYAWVLDK